MKRLIVMEQGDPSVRRLYQVTLDTPRGQVLSYGKTLGVYRYYPDEHLMKLGLTVAVWESKHKSAENTAESFIKRYNPLLDVDEHDLEDVIEIAAMKPNKGEKGFGKPRLVFTSCRTPFWIAAFILGFDGIKMQMLREELKIKSKSAK